ncbi:MAG: NusG domain II-containing protein [Eubacterium sp.]|nr:NusG domain II-containing protein [Eubacterium sp.]MCM1304972.1 NusG domain II-containing protein [Butyrivibrio sp.]MCM1344505.1 NusG domain II-containing protein [Muribaculaceae bacterium]MCM1411798.1 NusG domain II-containing protein [Lachnospiraceae bacterium]
MKTDKNYRITIVIIVAMLCLVIGISLAVIFFPASRGTNYVAEIYQDGELLTSIPLDGMDAPWRFTVTGENGCTNEIEVRSDSIGIVSADCPDKLCVHQGFISNASLPVICLPNRLVIRLRDADSESIDTIAY